jgi:hypothetical protein
MWGKTNRRIMVQTRPGMKRDTISKITNAERAGSMAQVVEHLPTKYQGPEFDHQYHKLIN